MATPVTTEIRNHLASALTALSPQVSPGTPFKFIRKDILTLEQDMANSTRFFNVWWGGSSQIQPNTGGINQGEFMRDVDLYILYRGGGKNIELMEEMIASDHDQIMIAMQQPSILSSWSDGALDGVFPASDLFIQYKDDETAALVQIRLTVSYRKGV